MDCTIAARWIVYNRQLAKKVFWRSTKVFCPFGFEWRPGPSHSGYRLSKSERTWVRMVIREHCSMYRIFENKNSTFVYKLLFYLKHQKKCNSPLLFKKRYFFIKIFVLEKWLLLIHQLCMRQKQCFCSLVCRALSVNEPDCLQRESSMNEYLSLSYDIMYFYFKNRIPFNTF